jgi:hypothetical protein
MKSHQSRSQSLDPGFSDPTEPLKDGEIAQIARLFLDSHSRVNVLQGDISAISYVVNGRLSRYPGSNHSAGSSSS